MTPERIQQLYGQKIRIESLQEPAATGQEVVDGSVANKYVAPLTLSFWWNQLSIPASKITDLAGAEPTVSYTAGENLSSGKAVIKSGGKVYLFNPTNVSHAGKVIGITTTSGVTDGSVSVQAAGVLIDASFSFTEGSKVFATQTGLSTTAPNVAVLQIVGVASDTGKLLIRIDNPIIRIP